MNPLETAILQIMSEQSEGYICNPMTSAFIAAGLEDFEGTKEALASLGEEGYTEFYTVEEETDLIKVERDKDGNPIMDEETGNIVPILDEDGNIQIETVTRTVDAGWIITDAGKQALE